ncbi:MAG: capsid protein, partial [Sphingomonas hengshuiensis]
IEDPDIGLQGGNRVRSGERVRELVVAQDVGYFIQNAVA